MDNHPIPQDITGFQFKLIGNMTIKQFAYLAAGAVAAWVVYSSPLFFLIKYPLVFIFALGGACFAFVPIEGRPMDVMLANFIRALFNPTQFVYEKSGGHLYEHHHKLNPKHGKREEKKEEVKILSPQMSAPIPKKSEAEKKEMVFFSSLPGYQANAGKPQTVTPNVVAPHVFDKAPLPQEEVPNLNDQKEKQMEAREQELQKELLLAKQKETAAGINPAIAQKAHQEAIALEEELRLTIDAKNKLEQQLNELNRKLEQQKTNFFTPSVAQAPHETKNIRVVPQGLGNAIGLPITQENPNVISGIVKDPRGNPLPNILVEVKDADANPVRAFKTNGVGQFASATALTNGVYTIEFEDPKEENKFDAIQFEAKGEIVLPIEVISVDKREELRRELFN